MRARFVLFRTIILRLAAAQIILQILFVAAEECPTLWQINITYIRPADRFIILVSICIYGDYVDNH